jgi:hypothetical protein
MKRAYLALVMLTFTISCALAQDPGMMASQAAQQAAQISQQAAQQANDQMMQASQLANQTAMQNAQQASMSSPACYGCYAAKPRFSMKPGPYAAPITVKMKDSTRGAVIYYTTDGWTPTAASTRYAGPITIDSTTSLQAIAISPLGGRSRIATAVYTMNGVTPTTASSAAASAAPGSPAVPAESSPSEPGKVLLARGTSVPLVFAADVNSKTAEIGDRISLTLAEDLKAGNVVVARKGAVAVARVTQVDSTGRGGLPGEVFFQVDSLQAGSTLIKLHGSAAKEGQDKVRKAIGLMFVPGVPAGMFVHGKDAEIQEGTTFTAFVDADTLLSPAP